MAKKFFLSVLLASNISVAGDFGFNITPTSEPTPEAIETTAYFAYWSLWLGNIYGIFDVLGWTLDWFSPLYFMFFYHNEPVVDGLRVHLKSLQEAEIKSHKERIRLAADLLGAIIFYLENKLDEEEVEEEELLKLIDDIIIILKEESKSKDHTAIDVV